MQPRTDSNENAGTVGSVDQVPVFFNPLQEGYFDNPYAHYAELREHDPVHQSLAGLPICFAYDDIRQVLIDGTTSMNVATVKSINGNLPGADNPPLFPKGVISIDAPDHTRVRRLMMSRSFTPRKVHAFSDWIISEVDQLLDNMEHQWAESHEPIDLIANFAFPLPFKVISDIIGMPTQDHQQVREWAQAISSATDPASGPEKLAAAHAAYVALSDYVSREVLPWKRANPTDDLLSGLLVASDDGGLSEPELLDQVSLLYVAGHETTVSLIGNSILNLLRNRAQLERLQSTPDLLGNAIEELNRYDSAIQFNWRYTLSDLSVGDTVIPPGQMILLCLGSANRDKSHFGEDADELDLTRSNASEAMSFGAGAHFCLGNALARKEAAIAIGRFFKRFPKADFTGQPVWNSQITFRGLSRLDVALSS
ncbi:cytochrome P450 [Mycobacterium paraintracellulare]|uniref:cytochrome P450 n=1 Tax=Mycobacterium paraintracellulare TaxID=1138383 RepID=UPI0019291CF2|nr:cytochrome P450 [Mycobacterium paraintracellulare]BCP14185.1 cytochrome P450 [Mycobacterium paraintracellulare]